MPETPRPAVLRPSATVFVAFMAASAAIPADWPQWRGERRDGISCETDWFTGWAEGEAPAVAWKAPVGKGHSAISVAHGRAVTMGWDGEQDTVFCFDAATGRTLWKQSYPCGTIIQWPGPRSTPTIQDGVVYTLGLHGQLRAWIAASGEPVWERDLPADYNPDVDYGFCWSPLVMGEHLILNCGSRGLAIRTRDGAIAWGDDKGKGACVSAVPWTHRRRQAVLVMPINADRTETSLVGVDPQTGAELFRGPAWKEQWGAMGVDPVTRGESVFITSAQELRQSARFTLDRTTLKRDWETNRVAGYTGGAVLIRDHLYLVDAKGLLKCVEWSTGRETWVQRGFDERGTLIAAGDVLLVQSGASGKLTLVAADPAKFRTLREATVLASPADTYTAPTLGNGRVYVRSYAGEVVCLDAKAEGKRP